TGKTGTGKSALINGLIGKNVSKEGETLKPETTEVAYSQRIVNGVPMKVFDSPGLQDGTSKEHEYVQDMSEKCKELDLILYTIKMTDARMYNDDVRAMRILTVAFTEEFWSKTMITLTFANEVQVAAEPGMLDYERNYEKFQTKMQLWNDTLRYVLNTTLGISSDIVNKVPIVPAGYYKVRDLPGRRYWFSEFWKTALNRMKDKSEDRARFMLEYSKDRWQKVYESTPDDFEEDIEKQRIYENKESKGWLLW
ncbi:MAG: 50S ribosome-binding GTPase, partial [Proteobacteria bacterium]|nr:50S ribosome-binding GTPase [Pseudomonadota bacterium]